MQSLCDFSAIKCTCKNQGFRKLRNVSLSVNSLNKKKMKYCNQTIHFRQTAFLLWFIFFCLSRKGFYTEGSLVVTLKERLLSEIPFSKEALSVLNKPCNKFKPGGLKFCL